MSDKPSILEGGSSRNFSPVDSLSINKQSDGLSTWVLADSVEVGSLDASQNGLYLAIEDDYFAYDQIVVNVSDDLADADDATKATGKIVGKDPGLDPNNDYAVGLDEEGNLTTEMVPAAIHIVVPPRKLKYKDGETIDFTGIHVYLMDGNNKRYTDSSYPTGEIPFGELIFPVTSATGGGTHATTSDLETVLNKPIPWVTLPISFSFVRDDGYTGTCDISAVDADESVRCCIVRFTNYESVGRECLFVTSKTKEGYVQSSTITYKPNGDYNGTHISKFYFSNRTEYDNRIAFSNYEDIPQSNTVTLFLNITPVSNISTDINHLSGEDAWTIQYGTEVETENEEIPVQWMRSDGEILEDSFTIEIVAEGEETGGDEQPQSDPFVGYADISSNGHFYNINRKKVPQIHYANGYVWQEGISTEYSVEQAASLELIILLR